MNKVCEIGRIVTELELKTTTNGKSVVNFRIAVRSYGKDNDDYFFNCVAWGSVAEFICKYFSKGRKIGIDGKLTSRTYETEKKEKRQVVEIMIQDAEFCDDKRDESGDDVNITTPSKAESTTSETEDELPF